MIYLTLDEKVTQALEDAYDAETGELIISEEDLEDLLERISEDHDAMLDTIVSEVKNLDAEAAAIAGEIKNLTERKRICENKRDRDKRLLAYLLHGEKWKNARHTISYRRSDQVVLDEGFMEWAEINAPGLLNVKVEPRKADIKDALKNGVAFEYAHLESKNNIQIK